MEINVTCDDHHFILYPNPSCSPKKIVINHITNNEIPKLVKKHYKENYYVNAKIHDSKKFINNEKKAYKILIGTDIIPRLQEIIEYTYIFTYNDDEDNVEDMIHVMIIVMEHEGESLAKKYDLIEGPGLVATDVLVDNLLFNKLFDPTKLPVTIINSIKDILLIMINKGVIHEDVHAGNFLINSKGIVHVVDFECVSFRF